MNNSDLADSVAAANDLSKADARKLVDAVFVAIADAAAKGEEVSLNGREGQGYRLSNGGRGYVAPAAPLERSGGKSTRQSSEGQSAACVSAAGARTGICPAKYRARAGRR